MTRFGLFELDALAFAIPLLRLQKIVHQRSGYRLPRLPDVVAETLVEHGQLIPLLTLAGLPGTGKASVREVEYKVIAESEGGLIAFPAEVTCGIVAENKGKLFSGQEECFGVAGIFSYQEKDYKVLDIDFLALEMTRAD